MFSLARENKTRQAADIFFESLNPYFTKVQDDLVKISDDASKSANANYTNAQKAAGLTQTAVVALQFLAILATLGFSIFTTKSIVVPVKEIEKAAGEMSKGSLHIQLNYQSKDELGVLADSMRATISNIGNMIDDISNLLTSLAMGDFRIESQHQEQYVQDYEPILMAMCGIRNNLSEALFRINQSADLVANGSEQVSSAPRHCPRALRSRLLPFRSLQLP
uniref:HAMP domain-containing protein n=1 Tax=Clostridium sp. NkU-1 TaxID=1095009 RepID=UPI0006D1BD02